MKPDAYEARSSHFAGCKVWIFAVHPTDGFAAVVLKHDPTLYLFDYRSGVVQQKIPLSGARSAGSGLDHKWGDIRGVALHDVNAMHTRATPLQGMSFRDCGSLLLGATGTSFASTTRSTVAVVLTDSFAVTVPLRVCDVQAKSLHRTKESLFSKLSAEEVRPLSLSCCTPLHTSPCVAVAATTGKVVLWNFGNDTTCLYPNAPRTGVSAMQCFSRTADDIGRQTVCLLIGSDDGQITCVPVSPSGFEKAIWSIRQHDSPVQSFCFDPQSQTVYGTSTAFISATTLASGDEASPKLKLSKKHGTPLGVAVLLQGASGVASHRFAVPYTYNKVYLVGESLPTPVEVFDLSQRKSGDKAHIYGCSAPAVPGEGFFVSHNQGLLWVARETAPSAAVEAVDTPHAPRYKARLGAGGCVEVFRAVQHQQHQGAPTAFSSEAHSSATLPNAKALYPGRWLGVATATQFAFHSWEDLAPISRAQVGSLSPPRQLCWGGDAWCAAVYDSGVFVFHASAGRFRHACSICLTPGAVAWGCGGGVLFVDTLDAVLAVFPYQGGYDSVVVATACAASFHSALTTVLAGSIGTCGVAEEGGCVVRMPGPLKSISCSGDALCLVSEDGVQECTLPPAVKWRVLAQLGMEREARSWALQGNQPRSTIDAFLKKRCSSKADEQGGSACAGQSEA